MGKWWESQIGYQIWPKSFYDSNGDGIGDLAGITQKLDYLQKLGIGILWISPFYPSPLADEGYDVSDYYGIDPRFGTMSDFEELLKEAGKRDIHVIMDLVVSHCSDEHEWFRKACENPEGTYGEYFYIRDWDGEHLPTNWRTYFGGPVWDVLPGHPEKLYLHSFHRKQPDLNWENPDLRQEIYKMMNWWLDKGVAGFRLDAIINIKKAIPFHDYPADRPDGLSSITNMLKDQKGIGEFLAEMRDATFAKHDAFSVGEVFDSKPADLPLWIGQNGWFSSMFDFSGELAGKSVKGWYASEPFLSPEEYKQCIFTSQENCGNTGFLSNIIENHDEPRGVSHYLPQDEPGAFSDRAKKLLAGTYFFLRGIPFIYQGQELGMDNVPFHSADEIDDVSTLDELRVAERAGLSEQDALQAVAPFSRDNARTPMQWSRGANGGFTEGTPWMRVNPDYIDINAEQEEKDPDSVLSFYRRISRLRRENRWAGLFSSGDIVPYRKEQKNLIAYLRRNADHTVLVLGNFQAQPVKVPLPPECVSASVILSNDSVEKDVTQDQNRKPQNQIQVEGKEMFLSPWQFIMLELK